MLTLVTAVGTLLYLMFSTGEETVRRGGLFGSLSFETKEVRDGVTGATMGVANPTALIVIFVLFAVVLGFAQIAFRGLKQYRAELVEERASS